MAGGFSWTSDNEAYAAQLWRDGWSASQIARRFGCTRSAVLGKFHQIGLQKPQNAGGPARERAEAGAAAAPKPAAKREAAPSAATRRHVAHLTAAAARAARFACEVAAPPTEGSITIVDLTDRMCRWPFGDPLDLEAFKYCGAAKGFDGGPYCAAHARLAVNPAAGLKLRAPHACSP